MIGIGVSFGGVTRRDGGGAIQRSNYQMGMEYGSSAKKVRGSEPAQHLRQWLLLPQAVDRDVWTRELIWATAAAAEARSDAREARSFDVGWPRELPVELMEATVKELYRPFVEMGLPVQVDAERSLAADGKPNDHLHGLIGTRVMTNDGFALKKCRQVDAWFRAGVRSHVADVFNGVAQASGLLVTFDHRPNVERVDELPPEDYLPRRRTGSAAYGRALARRNAHRRLRHEYKDLSSRILLLKKKEAAAMAGVQSRISMMTFVTSAQAGGEQQPIDVDILAAALAGLEATADPFVVPGIGSAFVIMDTLLLDTGSRIFIDGPIGGRPGEAILLLSMRKGWRDLSLVDGSGMPLPLTAIQERPTADRKDVAARTARLRADVIAAARWVADQLAIDNDDRQQILEKVLRRDNPALSQLVGRLARIPLPESFTLETLEDVLGSTLGELDLWTRYRLEQDLSFMLVPGHALSRPFKVPSGFAESYQYGESN